MKTFQPKIFTALKKYSFSDWTSDLVAGIIVAVIALPLSIALAIASGVSPEKGIYTAIVAGFIIAFLGGSRVNISGPTAAFATIVAGIVFSHGLSGLVLATIMAGLILILFGILRLGSLIQYIPYTITTGFTAGIAVTIALGQVKDFLGLTYPAGTPSVETLEKAEAAVKNITTLNPWALLVGAVSLLILALWPKISKKIPASLICVIVGVVMVKVFSLEVNTIGDLYTISGGLPPFEIPSFDLNAVKTLLPSAFTIAILAAIESLLSCVVSDGMIGDRHNSNTELIALGLGNIASGLFGGIPATGAIARTAANVKNGGKTPVAGMVHAVVLLLVLIVLMPYAAWIPMPVIAAILFSVAYNMSGWRSFVKICKTAPKSDILVLVATFVLTVVFDLVVAIEIGMILAAALFLKRMADNVGFRACEKAPDGTAYPEDTAVYEISGPMFFAATEVIAFPAFSEKTKKLILRMEKVPAIDISGIRNLETILEECRKKEISLQIVGINPQPEKALKKYGIYEKIISSESGSEE